MEKQAAALHHVHSCMFTDKVKSHSGEKKKRMIFKYFSGSWFRKSAAQQQVSESQQQFADEPWTESFSSLLKYKHVVVFSHIHE